MLEDSDEEGARPEAVEVRRRACAHALFLLGAAADKCLPDGQCLPCTWPLQSASRACPHLIDLSLPLPCFLPGWSLQQTMTRRDFASDADWEEYQASGMPSRQAEGRAKVVSRVALIPTGELAAGVSVPGPSDSRNAAPCLSERIVHPAACPTCHAYPSCSACSSARQARARTRFKASWARWVAR